MGPEAAPEAGKHAHLTAETQNALSKWRKANRYGLWVHSKRSAGSTYTASVAVSFLWKQGHRPFEYWTARGLLAYQRSYWSSQEEARKDLALYDTAWDMEETLDELWFAPVLWIDDMHEPGTNVKQWLEHVWTHVEERVKRKQHTVISTSLPPNRFTEQGLDSVILDRFSVIKGNVDKDSFDAAR